MKNIKFIIVYQFSRKQNMKIRRIFYHFCLIPFFFFFLNFINFQMIHLKIIPIKNYPNVFSW